MNQGNLKGVGGGASGILSGVAAVATVIAAIVGILSQFGLITSHDAPKTVAGSPIREYRWSPKRRFRRS
jgi:hypothetical protein